MKLISKQKSTVKIEGPHVFLEGELIYREYDRTIETESGPVNVPWPVTETVVESLSVLIARRGRNEKEPHKSSVNNKML